VPLRDEDVDTAVVCAVVEVRGMQAIDAVWVRASRRSSTL